MNAAPVLNQPNLGDIIRERRLSLGLTKSEAARRAGVSRGTWHDVENGSRTNMLADTLNQFDKALGYQRGTLRNAGRSGASSDIEVGGGGRRVVEQLKQATDDDALRLQLVQYVVTMPASDLHRLSVFISTGAAAGQEWLRAELREILRDDPQQVLEQRAPNNDIDSEPPPPTRRGHIREVATPAAP